MSDANGSRIRTYHGQPVLKEPVWTWQIPSYFFAGGLAGASAGLAFASELRSNDVLARRAWALATLGVAASPALLISDLGRPERFFNMLRMFKPTSPMSVGSWILGASGATTALSAANAWTGVFPRSAKLAKPAAALLGLPLASYTGALLANTAVPVWHESRRMLPFVFVSGAALSAGAGAVAATAPAQARPARRLALLAAAAEVASKELMERQLGEQGEPYRRGQAQRFGDFSRGAIAVGSALLTIRGGCSRAAASAAGALLCAGALSARWSVFKAGVQGAGDPLHVIAPQRRRVQSGESRGASRGESKLTGQDQVGIV